MWFAVTEKPGRATKDVLGEAIPAIIRAFPWPKSQRWGAASLSTESLRWVRPLSGIVAILGEDLVECEIGGVKSGFATRGHRFHHDGEITIGGAGDYAEKLRACHVIVDHAEREALVRDKAKAAAEAAGLVLVEDERLVIENAGLTEWPVPLLGRFDATFLDVPPEVIQLTARVNQKYFVCTYPPQNGEGGHAQHGGGGSPHAQPFGDNPLHHPAGGPPPRSGEDRSLLAKHYPNDLLISGFDILFFWDARMAMQGLHFMKEVPWKKLYLHGLVRAADGAKMSKSKGNVVDPLGGSYYI
ncbi:MAG: hypothetical protein B7X78_05400, partial [Sphingomonadales bacterium 39-62-4]